MTTDQPKRNFKVLYTSGMNNHGMLLVVAADHHEARAIWQKYQTSDAKITEVVEEFRTRFDPKTGKVLP